jgi:hypothetical protein
MFLRTVKVRDKDGTPRDYLRLVESYWEDGRSKQRVVLSLGRKDVLAPHLDSLIRIFRGEQPKTATSQGQAFVHAEQAACWGTMTDRSPTVAGIGTGLNPGRLRGKTQKPG